MSSSSPLARLRLRITELGAPLCLGVDPHPDQLPDGLPRNVAGVEAFARGLIEAAAGHAVAVKLNVAFFEAFGSAGWAALERVRSDVPEELVCILDAKRGDIGSTAERYAAGLLGHLGADAVTLSPYLGEDAVEPFLAYPDRLVYLLARTSNPSAERFQGLGVEWQGDRGEPDRDDSFRLDEAVARWAADRWIDGRVGLVVGATAPSELAALRRLVPELGFLVPGVGAQGGDLATAVRNCHGAAAPGLVSVSRAIAAASAGRDWRSAAASAAESLLARMREVGATLPA